MVIWMQWNYNCNANEMNMSWRSATSCAHARPSLIRCTVTNIYYLRSCIYSLFLYLSFIFSTNSWNIFSRVSETPAWHEGSDIGVGDRGRRWDKGISIRIRWAFTLIIAADFLHILNVFMRELEFIFATAHILWSNCCIVNYIIDFLFRIDPFQTHIHHSDATCWTWRRREWELMTSFIHTRSLHVSKGEPGNQKTNSVARHQPATWSGGLGYLISTQFADTHHKSCGSIASTFGFTRGPLILHAWHAILKPNHRFVPSNTIPSTTASVTA